MILSELISIAYPFYLFILSLVLLTAIIRSRYIVKYFWNKITNRDLLLLSFFIGLGFILRIIYTSHIDLDPYGWGYILEALSIKKLFFPSPFGIASLFKAFHIPGYPFFISPLFIFSKNIITVSIYNSLFSSLTIGVIFFLTYFLTEDKFASFFAATMLMTSAVHVYYGGQEIPISISVFFVTIAFLYLILWIKNKEIILFFVSFLLLLFSINIKIENSIFFPLFLIIFFKESTGIFKSAQGRKYLIYCFISLIFSLAIWSPFIRNLYDSQTLIFNRLNDKSQYFSLLSLFRHFYKFIIQRYYGFPLYMVAGYIIFYSLKRSIYKGYIVCVWFFVSILYFNWYSDIFSEWNMLQILIPIFIMSGYVISKTLGLFFKTQRIKYVLLFTYIIILTLNTRSYCLNNKIYSWVELKNDLESVVPKNSCVISFNVLTSKFSLKSLLPNLNWIFIDESGFPDRLSKCKCRVYYLNPVPYGLTEEADSQRVSVWDNEIKNISGVVEFRPSSAAAYNNSASGFYMNGDFKQAISYLTKAIEIKPSYDEYFNRAVAYYGNRDFNQAILDFTKAIEIKPHSAEAYYNRAVTYHYRREYDKAWDDVHEAESLGYKVKPDLLEALKKASGR